MAQNPNDPFLIVQSDVIQALEQTRQTFSSYLRIRATTTSIDSPELQQSKAELETVLSELSTDLSDLAESIRVVEVDPYKYGLDIDEVSRRRRFVRDVESEVDEMMGNLKRAPQTYDSSAANYVNDPHLVGAGGGSSAVPVGADSYTQWEQEQQQVMMAEQDEVLDSVYRTVGNLREQAHEMGRELEEQAEMLGEVDRDITRVQDKLTHGMKRVAYVIKKNEETASTWCIYILIFVLIILLALLLIL